MMSSSLTEAVAAQLSRELGIAAHRVAVIVGVDAAIDWPRAAAGRASHLAELLCSSDEDATAQAVVDVMNALWPHGDPEDVDQSDWWRTPLGLVCARSLGRTDAESITHAVAAAMLGVERGTVSTLVSRGTLDRHPLGGVDRASVLRRIARQVHRPPGARPEASDPRPSRDEDDPT